MGQNLRFDYSAENYVGSDIKQGENLDPNNLNVHSASLLTCSLQKDKKGRAERATSNVFTKLPQTVMQEMKEVTI